MLEVKNLTKVYANKRDAIAGGVNDVSFSLEPGAFFTLLGPSGCGKTTTLRCIAGLERPDSGSIRVGNDVFFDGATGVVAPMNGRNIGMVFQSYAVWPHLTLFENVAFPLRVSKERRYRRDEIDALVNQALNVVDLGGYQSRSATLLSGGQQQRVALARAIVRHPRLLLLDEPLSNLDATLRQDMCNELKRLQRQIGVTTVYVTHDQAEALAMSDLIAVMDRGRIVQVGTPHDIYFRPRNVFVAGFVGSTNLLSGRAAAAAIAGGTQFVSIAGGTVASLFSEAIAKEGAVLVSVRPEAISISPIDGPKRDGEFNRIEGKVLRFTFLGNMNRYDVQVGGDVVQVTTDPLSSFPVGASVALDFAVAQTIAMTPEAPPAAGS